MRPASPPCFFLNSFQYCTFFKLSQHDIGVLKPNIRLVLRPLKYFKIFSKKSKISMFFLHEPPKLSEGFNFPVFVL